MKRAEIKVTGQVQGVFFRQGVKAEADRLGVTGLASNKPDGSVLIIAEGEEDSLQRIVDWARVGTEWAKVEKVDVKWGEAAGEFKDFKIK